MNTNQHEYRNKEGRTADLPLIRVDWRLIRGASLLFLRPWGKITPLPESSLT